MSFQSFGVKKQALKECLRREYASLFDPFERQFYTPDVSFADPMTSFTGMEKYQRFVRALASSLSSSLSLAAAAAL